MRTLSKYEQAQKNASNALYKIIVSDEFNVSDLLRVYYSQGMDELSYYLFSVAHYNKIDNMDKIDYPALSIKLLSELS